jgi:hypothetical protein
MYLYMHITTRSCMHVQNAREGTCVLDGIKWCYQLDSDNLGTNMAFTFWLFMILGRLLHVLCSSSDNKDDLISSR